MISTKGRYSIRILLDLAEHRGVGYTPIKDVAARQSISLKYVEKLMPALKNAGLLDSSHGIGGGYRLNRDPEQYDLWEILRVTEGELAPVSCLQVDVPIGQAGRVTLAEVEALDALEPYGAGNARPVFCLRGATLDRLQNVGQNRHLKLRLTKGSAQFDGIFFSAVAQTCGVAPGDRVDAAFYLQINEFRSSRTVQMQMVDIRPSLTGSTREEESLELVDRCLRGDELRPRDAVRLLPSRDQCVSLWRALQHTVPPEGLTACYLPLLRELSARLEGADPFLRTAFCLEVFRERGLLQCRRLGDSISLHLTSQGKKVALDRSEYLLRLHRALDTSRGGAR